MNEKLLQYLWNFKIFNNFDFKDVQGNTLEILEFGTWNFDSGPDFLLGKIKTKDLVLVGNIELHVKSSDWIFHRHSGNPEFKNIIAHVVFIHDIEIEEFTDNNIPTLELKNYIDEKLLSKYQLLLEQTQFIPCEKIFDIKHLPVNFHEENLLKKLDVKSIEIEERLQTFKNNYEAVLFHQLAYAFGLKVNAPLFKQLAESINYTIFNKIRQNQTQLEALLFGMCNWLENPLDEQTTIWKREFEFLKKKYQLSETFIHPKFSKLRPPNFPTIRLSQLASLYHANQNLFSKLITAKNIDQLYFIFTKVAASEYWYNHYNFGKISPVQTEKRLTKDFIALILINAVLPLRYTYHKNTSASIVEDISTLYQNIPAENNTIIENWKSLGAHPKNALESQSLLYHYHHLCLTKNCLNCSIGLSLMKS
ncbi:DUF2851 family protein [Chryseobacterium sp. SNU WT5]|uniref:DUF2851 family protein n=1 Tax=Chryseobacterium sp. SNU WT5 TaxID=2594269 RepID=UPI001180063D|nr:DUF2851 family protein [Chryseobacterium sp. SNU WT5]QDP85003.1 DUF2851 family protein [Chryseobacterium sp. SNU WT5]